MLSAVICGMEHSGTTLVSDLLRQTGSLESGFECGVLMAKSPRQFPAIQPFYDHMCEGWNITDEQLVACCDNDTFPAFYRCLASASPLIRDDQKLFDKTPRYVAEIETVMAHCDAPIICVNKDPRATVFSDYRRSGAIDFDKWFEEYAPFKKRYMRRCYEGYLAGQATPDRFCAVSLEQLCFAARTTCERLFEHAGQDFSIDYLVMDKLRYKNTRAKFVSADIVLEYKQAFSREQQSLIEKEFSEFTFWFYD